MNNFTSKSKVKPNKTATTMPIKPTLLSWNVILTLSILLGAFSEGVNVLGGDKYPTMSWLVNVVCCLNVLVKNDGAVLKNLIRQDHSVEMKCSQFSAICSFVCADLKGSFHFSLYLFL